MGCLSSRDYERLIALLPELYLPMQTPDFIAHSLRVLRAAIPADSVAWIEYAPGPPPKFEKWVDLRQNATPELRRMESGLPSHPFSQHFAAGRGATDVLFLPDFSFRVRQTHRAEYDDDIYRAPAISDATFCVLGFERGRLLAVMLNRKDRGFSERDRLFLTLMRGHLCRAYENARCLANIGSRRDSALSSVEHFGLTTREREVARWLSSGKTNAEIGMILGVASRTVEKHVEAILRKLHAENRTTAAVLLRRIAG